MVICGNAKKCELTGLYRIVESRIHSQIVRIVDVSVSPRNLGRIPENVPTDVCVVVGR
jgi:hypothetical protein